MGSKKRILSSRTIALFVLVFTGVLIGFSLSFFFFTGGTFFSSEKTALAQDRSGTAVTPAAASITTPSSFRNIAEPILPAIVQLNVTEMVEQQDERPSDVPWFYYFFQQPPGGENAPNQTPNPLRGLGSGVIVQKNGNKYYVLTNEHVAGGATEIEVSTYGGDLFKGQLVGSDSRRDLALISFESNVQLPIARLGDSDALHVGDWVLAIGNPFGFTSSVTAGIVSALGRRGGPDGNINDFIQTDASINQGNSGGALVNMTGEIVGINTWIATPSGVSIGLGFAIPINNAKRAIDDFINSGSVQYGWLGVSISDIPQSLLAEYNVVRNTGAFVHHIFKNSPAETGGLRPGDIILELNGVKITMSDQLTRLIGDLRAGETARFKIKREGKETTLSIRIARRESQETIVQMQQRLWPGLTVLPLLDEYRTQFNVGRTVKGVLIAEVESRTPADVAGLRPGDVVTSVNDRTIQSVTDFYRQLNASPAGEIRFRFIRGGAELSAGIAGIK